MAGLARGVKRGIEPGPLRVGRGKRRLRAPWGAFCQLWAVPAQDAILSARAKDAATPERPSSLRCALERSARLPDGR